jgi:hypothetical protein
MNISVFFVICSAITFAATEIIKPITKVMFQNKDVRTFVIRLFACLVGGLAGFQLADTFLGMWLGFASGVLNSIVIAYIQIKYSTHILNSDKKDD